MFNIGDKVVCIDDSVNDFEREFIKRHKAKTPIKGQTYTVRDLTEPNGLLLEEILNEKPLFGFQDATIELTFERKIFKLA